MISLASLFGDVHHLTSVSPVGKIPGASPTGRRAEELLKEAKDLLRPNEEGEGFGRHYFIAMQRDPDVLLAHAAVAKLGK